MSYLELANLLDSLAKTLAHNHENLAGEPLAKAASGLQKSAAKFETILNDFLSGSDPSVRELEGLLKTPAKLLPLNGLNMAFRGVFGSPLTANKLPAARREFLARVKKEHAAEKAVNSLKQLLSRASEASALPTDKVGLQNELLRLGGLSDEELKWEFDKRLNTVAALKAIAEANSLPVPKRAAKRALIEVITHYARRAHANVAHRA